MLDYLKDNSVDNQNKPAENPAKDDSQREYLTTSTQKNKTRNSNIIIAVVFIGGVLLLAFIANRGGPAEAVAAQDEKMLEQARMEQAVARLTGIKSELSSGFEKIINKFYEFSDVRQVGVNELRKNPFELDDYLNSNNSQDMMNSDARNLQRRADKMELLAIIRSDDGNSAMINDSIYKVNDQVNGFRIESISADSVNLKADGVELTLKLTQ